MKRKLVVWTPRVLLVILFVAAFTLALKQAGIIHFYGQPGVTQNGGINYGDCGIELWGEDGIGHFCGDY